MPGISGQSFSVPTPPITGQEVGTQDMSIARPAINPNVVAVRDFGETNLGVDLTVTNQAVATATANAAAALAAATGSLNAELVAHLATLDPSVNPCVSIAGKGTAGDQGGGTFVSVLVAGGPAIDNAMVFASSNALWRWKRVYTDHLAPAWFGCAGDGTTNDTAALQAALDATITYGVPLRCEALATYLVRYAGATYNGYALKLKHGTRLDLNGATIKLDADQWCSVLINEHIAGGGPDHVEIGNGIIDGNEANQTRVWSAGGVEACSWWNAAHLRPDRVPHQPRRALHRRPDYQQRVHHRAAGAVGDAPLYCGTHHRRCMGRRLHVVLLHRRLPGRHLGF